MNVNPNINNVIDPQQIAFTVITYYPKWYNGQLQSISHTDKVRGDLAFEFINKVTKAGYQLVVVDGKSSKSFKKALATIVNIKVINRRRHKRSPSKRQGFKAASQLPNVTYIIATEAEKTSLVDYTNKIIEPLYLGQADIVIPKREESRFKSSYPDYMYTSEIEGTRLYNDQLKFNHLLPFNTEQLDLLFGPRAFINKKQVLSLFMHKFYFKIGDYVFSQEYFDAEELSNAQFFPIVLALKKGFKVKSVEIPFVYPKLQKENESIGAIEFFKEKRRAQRLGLLVELMHFLNFISGKKSK